VRSKARHKRYDEDVKLIRTEMESTLSSFAYKQTKWEVRRAKAKKDGLPGHECYAAKQVILWDKMGKEAREAFELCLVENLT
jgi:hypothetical protein